MMPIINSISPLIQRASDNKEEENKYGLKWSGFDIKGNSAFVSKVKEHLYEIFKTNQGMGVLVELNFNRMKTLTPNMPIVESQACSFVNWPLLDELRYNPANCVSTNDCQNGKEDWVSVPNWVYLFHELAHAYLYYIMGKGYDSERECMATGLGKYFDEIPYNENKLRCELGLPIRPCYGYECNAYEAPVCESSGDKKESIQSKQNSGMKETTISPNIRTGIKALRGGGQPLPESVRNYFEPRFGSDFGRVRIHTDSQAAMSARELNARAYTQGHDIVFAAGEHSPSTTAGRRLLAHELTHVVQQRSNPKTIQRACGKKAIGPVPKDCNLVSKEPKGERFLFKANCDEFASNEEDRLIMYINMLDPSVKVNILGMASFDGSPEFNESLSCRRASRTKQVLLREGIPSENILFVEATGGIPPAHDPSLRAIDLDIKPAADVPPPSKKPKKPSKICGPDISSPLSNVFKDIQSTFAGWNDWQRNMCCFGLIQWLPGVVNPIMAWDIKELFLPNTGWLYERPYCPISYNVSTCHCGVPATGMPGSDAIEKAKTSPCGNSVLVQNKCFLAGTANYGTFGIMCKLCYDHSRSMRYKPWILPPINTVWFTEFYMKKLIWAYKTLMRDDPGPPTDWAVATYRGGPGGVSGTENRGFCKGRCGVPYSGKPFDFIWEPHKPR